MTPDKPITLNEYTKYQNITSWFQSILDRTTGPHTTPQYPNSLFYKLDDDVIFEYNQEDEDFWVDYYTIWSVFEFRFGMEYDETQELIKPMVEEHYKLESVTPQTKHIHCCTKGGRTLQIGRYNTSILYHYGR
jgi:hypothetical protein